MKAEIYTDEYYPFYYLRETKRNEGNFVREVPEELYKRYNQAKDELEKVFAELKSFE